MTDLLELAVVPDETALQVFTNRPAIDAYLDRIRHEVIGAVPDLSTKKGRDLIASTAFSVARTKVALVGIGKKLSDEQKEIPRRIDETNKYITATLDALRDEVRRPLSDWEEAQVLIDTKIEDLRELATNIPDVAEEIDTRIRLLEEAHSAGGFGEREEEAKAAFDEAMDKLAAAYNARIKLDEELAELAEFRRQKAVQAENEARAEAERLEKERIQQEAERARVEAEAKAKAEEERKQREEKEEADRKAYAEAKRLADEAQKAINEQREKARQLQEENDRLIKEAARKTKEAEDAAAKIKADLERQEREEARRQANKRHQSTVKQAVLDTLIIAMPDITVEQAKRIVILIADGELPSVSINY